MSLIPGLGRSPGGTSGNLLWNFCWKNLMGRGALWAAVHGVAKSQTQLSDWACMQVVCCYCTVPKSCLTLWDLTDYSTPGCSPLSSGVCTNSCPLSWWCYLTTSSSANASSFCLQSFPASGSFPELALHIRWPKYWSLNITPSNEYSRLISFRLDWFDLPAVQGPLQRLHQHHNSKVSSFHIHTTIRKTIALIIWTYKFINKYNPENGISLLVMMKWNNYHWWGSLAIYWKKKFSNKQRKCFVNMCNHNQTSSKQSKSLSPLFLLVENSQ